MEKMGATFLLTSLEGEYLRTVTGAIRTTTIESDDYQHSQTNSIETNVSE